MSSAPTDQRRRARSSGSHWSMIGGCLKRSDKTISSTPHKIHSCQHAIPSATSPNATASEIRWWALLPEAINDMPAVQLPYRKQIQRRGEEPYPCGPPDGAEQKRCRPTPGWNSFRNSRMIGGLPNRIAAFSCTPGTIFEVAIAYAMVGTASTKPAMGPAIPISNKARRVVMGARIRRNAPNVPNRVGAGMKAGVADVDLVVFAGEEMAEFVGHQYRQQRKRKRNSAKRSRGCSRGMSMTAERILIAGEWLLVVGIREREFGTHRQRRDGRESEQKDRRARVGAGIDGGIGISPTGLKWMSKTSGSIRL